MLHLLKEFWVPLLVALAWTTYNVVALPRDQWSLRTFVNLFGPTFFFVSWLVAQWYRIRKQQRLEQSLTTIETGLRSLPKIETDLKELKGSFEDALRERERRFNE